MKIARRRQDADVAGMADFLRRVVRMIATIIVERLDDSSSCRQRLFLPRSIVGKIKEIVGAVEQPFGHEVHDLFRAALNGAFDQDQP